MICITKTITTIDYSYYNKSKIPPNLLLVINGPIGVNGLNQGLNEPQRQLLSTQIQSIIKYVLQRHCDQLIQLMNIQISVVQQLNDLDPVREDSIFGVDG